MVGAVFDEAIELSAVEAASYAEAVSADEDLGLAQCFHLDALTRPLSSGDEVFSLIRDVSADAQAYVDTYFSTGREHQQTSD